MQRCITMPLNNKVVRLFENPAALKTLTTLSKDGSLHAAPLTMLATPDGNKIIFSEVTARKTPENLEWMKKENREAIVVVQFAQYVSKTSMEGYSINVKVGNRITEGTKFEEYREMIFRHFAKTPTAIWELIPTRYRDHSFGPDRGKLYELEVDCK